MNHIENNQGTTLIEVLISIILVAITALGGIALYFNTTELQSIIAHKKMAIELANSQMEICRRVGCPATISPKPIIISGLAIPDGKTIKDEASTDWPGYDHKRVNIGWNEAGPTSRSFNVVFTTLVPHP